MASNKLAFLNQKPPPGYVAGVGRGATGFTTRGDIGPMRAPGEAEVVERGNEGRHPRNRTTTEEHEDLSESNFDKFSGYSGSLFANSEYDKEDEEADKVYDAVDEYMDGRRKEKREALERERVAKFRSAKPKVQQVFADVRDGLKTLTESDWLSIPDGSDRKRGPRRQQERFSAVPDSFIARAHSEGRMETSIDAASAAPTQHAPIDITQMSEARTTMIGAKLDQASSTVSGKRTVDREGYLTDMRSVQSLLGDVDINDLKRARLLLQSVIQSNPKYPPGWIARARLEEKAGKLGEARKIIREGCDACPTSEDCWIEAARLSTPEQAKLVLANAVKSVPRSVKIWQYAVRLEDDVVRKRRVLRKAIELIPNSVNLWKQAVELEDEEDARILLRRAVQSVPDSIELWLALARLESFEEAQNVLNRARQANPTDPTIWIAAASLQESAGQRELVDSLIARAVTSLAAQHVVISRDEWLTAAVRAEEDGAIETCGAIIRNTIGLGIEQVDRKRIWLDDAQQYLRRSHVGIARAILAHALTVFPGKKSVWIHAAQLERQHGTRQQLDALLERAVENCPRSEILWLMLAKEKWKADEIVAARQVLQSAFRSNPNSERIFLAAVKLEIESNDTQVLGRLLERARTDCGTEAIWLKSVKVAWMLGQVEETITLAQKALERFSTNDRIWSVLARAQLEGRDNAPAARVALIQGLKQCPLSWRLWVQLAQLEEKSASVTKARAVLDKARLKVPSSGDIWLAAIGLETRSENQRTAEHLMTDALRQCPTDGRLWSLAIEMEPRPSKRAKCNDAMKKCERDPLVILTIARLFWTDRKLEAALKWLRRAVELDPLLGDAWAALYKFLAQHGDPAAQGDVLRKCVVAEPRYGEVWKATRQRYKIPKTHTEKILLKAAKRF